MNPQVIIAGSALAITTVAAALALLEFALRCAAKEAQAAGELDSSGFRMGTSYPPASVGSSVGSKTELHSIEDANEDLVARPASVVLPAADGYSTAV